jgi:hypothetical protein
MTLRHLTGAQGVVKVGGVVWADATINFTLNQASASAKRGGKRSQLNLPGELSCTISAKNIMRTGAKIGGMLTDASTSGSAGTIKSGISVSADGWTDSASPTISTPSQVRVTVASYAMTTAGVLTVIGTDADGNPLEEPIAIGVLGVGEYATGKYLFKTVTGVYNTGIRSTSGGTLTVASIVGAAAYSVTANPMEYDLIFGGIDSITGNYILVTANNCFASKSALAFADANTVFMDDVTFTIEDLDADLSVTEVTTS